MQGIQVFSRLVKFGAVVFRGLPGKQVVAGHSRLLGQATAPPLSQPNALRGDHRSTVNLIPTLLLCLCALVTAWGISSPGFAQSPTNYDAVRDFSATVNPTGVWSYGSYSGQANFVAFSNHVNLSANVDTWQGSVAVPPYGNYPVLGANRSSSDYPYYSMTWKKQYLWLAPGPGGEKAVLRFAAPSAGFYTLDGNFQGMDSQATADIHIAINGSSLYDGPLNSTASVPFRLPRYLNQGDKVDFSVGYGANMTYGGDNVGLQVTISPGAVFDAVQDFSKTTNPNAATYWSYGFKPTLNGLFSAYSTVQTVFGSNDLLAWGTPSDPYFCPMVVKNTSSGPVTFSTTTQPNDVLNVHPGANGEYSTVRFVAPAPGVYAINGRYQGLENNTGTTTDIHVLKNGNELLVDTTLTGIHTEKTFLQTVTLAAGDKLDFSVGYGSNGNYGADSTGLAVTITPSGSYDAVNDFSLGANPNGVWTYGSKPTLTGTFTAFTYSFNPASNSNLLAWGMQNTSFNLPFVVKNTSGASVDYYGLTQPSDVLNIHPGASGEYSTVRFSTPTAGVYSIVGRFAGLGNAQGTTTDIHIRQNGVELLSDTDMTGLHLSKPFNLTRTLAQGDIIDFSVGYGSNGNYNNDSTGLAATITPQTVGSIPGSYVPLPDWAEGVRAVGTGQGAGGGPTAGDIVDLASGAYMHEPGADISSYNTVGPNVAFSRSYNSAFTISGKQSPGLPAGWVHNFDYFIQPNGNNLDLVYPSGAKETIQTNGAFSVPIGAPYFLAFSGQDIKITYLNESAWLFSPIGGVPANGYRLSRIQNLLGQAIDFLYIDNSSSRLLDRIVIGGTSTPLLTFTYGGNGLLSEVRDIPRQRRILYSYNGQNLLSDVSRLTPVGSTPATPNDWHYDYGSLTGFPGKFFVNKVTTPDPSAALGAANATTSHAQPIAYDPAYASVSRITGPDGNFQTFENYTGQQAMIKVFEAGQQPTDTPIRTYTQKIIGGVKNGGISRINGGQSSVAYDPTRPYFLIGSTNELGQQSSRVPDQYNRTQRATSPRQQTYANGTVTANLGVKYTYDTSVFAGGRISSAQVGMLKADGTFQVFRPAVTVQYVPVGTNGAGLIQSVTGPIPYYGTDKPANVTSVTTSYTYTFLGNVLTVQVPAPLPIVNNAVQYVSYSYGYTGYTGYGNYTKADGEALGQPTLITDPLLHKTRIQYDARGNILTIIEPFDSDAGGNETFGYRTDFVYNTFDQLVTVWDKIKVRASDGNRADNGTANFTTSRVSTVYTYQPDGGNLRKTEMKNADGTPFRTQNIALGKTAEVTQSSGNVPTVSLSYKGTYQVKDQKDGNNNTTSFSYDAEGKLTQMQFPGGGSDKISFPGYDLAGYVGVSQDGNGQVKTLVRAPDDNRITGVQYTNQSGQNVSVSHDDYNRVTQRIDARGIEAYTYDDLDNITSVTTTYYQQGTSSALQPQTVQYTYYPDGSRRGMLIPAGPSGTSGIFNYTYDADGRLTNVSNPWDALVNLTTKGLNFTYYDDDSLKQDKSSNATIAYSYDNRGFLLSQSTTLVPITSTFTISYSSLLYDTIGNLTQSTITAQYNGITQQLGSAPNPGGNTYYWYDNQDRLIAERRTEAGGAGRYFYDLGTFDASNNLLSPGFAYDNAENLTTIRNATVASQSLGYNANNQLTGTGFAYDLTGFSTQYRNYTLGQDVESRLTSINNGSAYQAAYRADGRRAWRVGGGTATYFIYDGTTLLYEFQGAPGSTTITNVYGWGANGLSQRYQPGNTSVYTTYVFDPLGNVLTRVKATNNSDLIEGIASYDSFGRRQSDVSARQAGAASRWSYTVPAAYSVGFAGQFGNYTETATILNTSDTADQGLLLSGSRYYDPNFGRSIGRGANGRNLNLYATDNNPQMGYWQQVGLFGLGELKAFGNYLSNLAVDSISPLYFVNHYVLGGNLSNPFKIGESDEEQWGNIVGQGIAGVGGVAAGGAEGLGPVLSRSKPPVPEIGISAERVQALRNFRKDGIYYVEHADGRRYLGSNADGGGLWSRMGSKSDPARAILAGPDDKVTIHIMEVDLSDVPGDYHTAVIKMIEHQQWLEKGVTPRLNGWLNKNRISKDGRIMEYAKRGWNIKIHPWKEF